MIPNNLRIIYRNLVDQLQSNGSAFTTLTASTTASGTNVANLKSDKKGLVWRSTGTTATLSLTFASATPIGGVIIPFCNLTQSATITVTTNVYTVTATLASPWESASLWNWGSNPLGSNTYAYGGGKYARVWIPDANKNTAVTTVSIVISDPGNSQGYIEASRLIVGPYWTPTLNTEYGLSMAVVDLSKHERTQSGDLFTTVGPRYTKMNFNLNWLQPADRKEFLRIIKGNGIAKPLFVSLFPNNTDDWEKEGHHQIYGKLSELSAITHTYYDFYSSSIQLEEV